MQAGATGDQPLASTPEVSSGDQPSYSRSVRAGAIALGLVLAAGTAAGVAWVGSSPAFIEKPIVYVLMEAADSRMAGEASQVRDTLMTALTEFTTLTVAKSGYPLAGTSKRHGRSYELHMKYYGDEDERSVWWQIADSGTDLVLKSGLETIDSSGRSMVSVREEIAGQLASRFAATRGVINTIEIQDDPEDVLGNTCVLRAEYALDDGSPARLASSRLCLEQTLALVPDDPDATAVYARVMLAGRGAQQDPAMRLRPLQLAKNAVSLAPLSDRAQVALMAAQFAAGNMDAALQAGNRAVELNPHNGEAAAKLAFVLYLAGYPDAGVAMAHGAGRNTATPPADALLVLALDAYRGARYSEASLFAEQINGTDLLVATLRTAALGQLSSPDAFERLSELKRKASDSEGGFRNGMFWWRSQQAITTELEAGLVKAGVSAEESVAAGAGRQ
jgi:tetratricopeptide (TPR) repeat protein